MKKLLTFTIALFLFSCSTDISEKDLSDEILTSELKSLESYYDGKIMSFSSEDEFFNAYNYASKLEFEEYQSFLKIKDGNNPLFLTEQSDVEYDVADDDSDLDVESFSTELNISGIFLSLFNINNQIQIADEIIELNKNGKLTKIDLDGKNEIYGYVENTIPKENYDGKSNLTEKAHNVNYTKTWTKTNGSRRVKIRMYNETVYLGNSVNSVLYYDVREERKSCSFWRCTWKSANITGYIRPNLSLSNRCSWNQSYYMNYTHNLYNTSLYTRSFAFYRFVGPCRLDDQIITGNFNLSSTYINHNFTGINYSYNPF